MHTTRAETTFDHPTTITGRLRRSLRLALVALVAVAAFSTATASPASALVGGHRPAMFRCHFGTGEVQIKFNVNGAYNDQWAAQRTHLWEWNGTRWVGNTSDWQMFQANGPSVMEIGAINTAHLRVAGIYAMATEVTFWQGNAWGPTSYVWADHFQDWEKMSLKGWCRA